MMGASAIAAVLLSLVGSLGACALPLAPTRDRLTTEHSATTWLQGLHPAFERDPLAFLEAAAKVLDVQMEMVLAMDSGDESKKREAEKGRLACLKSAATELQYPFEHLLDVDYIYDANNYLETWMNETYGPILTGYDTRAASATSASGGDKPDNKRDSNASAAAGADVSASASSQTSMPEVLFASNCYTHEDPRVERNFQLFLQAKPAPAGTNCLFGVTPEDEGNHCVLSGGKYGSFGWCYTRADKGQWGSCAEDCPSSGDVRVLSTRIERLSGKIQSILANMHKEDKNTSLYSASL